MFSGVVSGDIKNLMETSGYLSRRTCREQSEASIQKQLLAFERLLQHAMSRFSKDNLYHVLRHVTKWKEQTQKPPHKNATKVVFKLRSIAQLKRITQEMKEVARRTADDDKLFKHYELFLNDLLYLKDLKKYFDDEIYRSLLKYHYDDGFMDPSPRNKGPTHKLEKGRYVKVEDEDSGHGSPAELEDKQAQSPGQEAGPKKNIGRESERRYRQTVGDLQQIIAKWERLLSEDVPDLNDFDPDSYHELMQFSNYSQFETILRLVPDIFAKCFKCIDLAKSWLKESNVILSEIPDVSEELHTQPEAGANMQPTEENRQIAKDILKNISELQNQINDIDKQIENDEKALEEANLEMDRLVEREERFTTVTSDFHTIDSLITIAAGDYQKSKTEQYAVANKLRNHPKNSQAYAEIKSHLKRLDTEVLRNHSKMKFLEFNKATVTEDYLVELEVRPDFIRFVGDTKEKIQELERFLEVKQEEKVKLEKQLALTKTNTDRMKKIMNTYLGNEDFKIAVVDETPRNLTSAWTVKYNDGVDNSADGNEADVESPEPQGSGKSHRRSSRPSTSETNILQKPKLVKKVRDLRPSSEGNQKSTQQENNSRATSVKAAMNKMPKASLKSSPRRVWENF